MLKSLCSYLKLSDFEKSTCCEYSDLIGARVFKTSGFLLKVHLKFDLVWLLFCYIIDPEQITPPNIHALV